MVKDYKVDVLIKNKKCIVSFGSKGLYMYNRHLEDYNKGLKTMITSTIGTWDGDYLIHSIDADFTEYMGVEITINKSLNTHGEVPYQFKPAMIDIAYKLGYEQVVWVDSTIRMVKHPQELLDHAKKYGVCVFDNLGHPLKYWCSDIAQSKQGVTNAEMETMQQIMACVIIFDFTNPKGKEIFERWKQASLDGISFKNERSNREGFRGHRHDQAVLSMICAKESIPLLPYGYLVYPPHDQTKEYGDNIYFVNKGIN